MPLGTLGISLFTIVIVCVLVAKMTHNGPVLARLDSRFLFMALVVLIVSRPLI